MRRCHNFENAACTRLVRNDEKEENLKLIREGMKQGLKRTDCIISLVLSLMIYLKREWLNLNKIHSH